jgi:hypothetical protein
VSRSFALASAPVAALALALPTSATAKPCSGAAGVPSLEEMLPRASVAIGLAGTDQVVIDPTDHCIDVQVRTLGTARLVALLLRGVDVPWEMVEIRVVEAKPVGST